MRIIPALLAGLAIASYGYRADATTLVARDVGDLAVRASAIVHGTVVELSSSWNDQHSHIFTFAKIRVDESLKGDLGSTVTVLAWGGQVGSAREIIPGSPTFQTGEEVVLFLSVKPPMYPSVLSLAQGKFTVVTDPLTGLKTLARFLYGAELAGRGTTTAMPTLASLRSRIEASVGPPSGGSAEK